MTDSRAFEHDEDFALSGLLDFHIIPDLKNTAGAWVLNPRNSLLAGYRIGSHDVRRDGNIEEMYVGATAYT
jgi:hypothetical protein